MTNPSTTDISTDAEDQIRAGEELLSNGETEQLIEFAVETIALARMQGRLDIAEQAGAILQELSEQHAAIQRAHADLVGENENLKAAQEMLRAAEAEYRATMEALGKNG
ncbi:hypothetical protein IU449_17590 [Nocardia higoensis]|uniref:Uncharacterized protein n=1 Tax=Nocardia higoensis TaxID=228599 RepID=A0ABS0DCY7_9NOCA|nr:hypothetical protein [Nocardia higoensis]MBF6356335.1 hypothetical protein [Nocardia higoensis]